MRPRVLIAGLFHETHTFLEGLTRLEQFSVVRGDAMLRRAGDGSPLAAALEVGKEHGWQIVPALDCRAQPSATVDDLVVEQFWLELQASLRQALSQPLDALYLVLHGAMVTPSLPDVEGELLARLRAMPGAGEIPIFGVFDLHANFSPRMAQLADGLFVYRENPHSDAYAMARFAAEQLHTTLGRGSRATTYSRHAGIVWPPTGTGTSDSPMCDLEALARSLERSHPEFLGVNVVGGFAFADTPDTGVSFSVVTTGDEASAQAALQQLCDLAWQLRERGNRVDPSLDEVLQTLRSDRVGPTVVAEPSDNIGGGAPGDGTGLLRGLLAHKVERAAVCLCDAEAVAALQTCAIGERKRLALGGKGSSLDEGPVQLEVELISKQAGKFRLEDRQSHLASMYGDEFDMGPCAVVRHRGITILLTSIKTPPFDLGQWRSQGIEPARFAVVGVKAAVAHRRAYEPIAARMVSVDTPGPCRSDLRAFPYRRLARPVFPLDSV
jgi:microcystin degradation protein MlrC